MITEVQLNIFLRGLRFVSFVNFSCTLVTTGHAGKKKHLVRNEGCVCVFNQVSEGTGVRFVF